MRASNCWLRISSAWFLIFCSASSSRYSQTLVRVEHFGHDVHHDGATFGVALLDAHELVGDRFDERVVGADVGRDVTRAVRAQLLSCHIGRERRRWPTSSPQPSSRRGSGAALEREMKRT